MPKAPKNWRHLGYIIPDVIDPEENICVCVPVPKDRGHIRAFLGQLTELSKWLTWEKDGTDSAKRAAARWFDITQCVAEEIECIMTNGCGCGSSQVTNSRINPDTGTYEVSYDGGITWIPDPANDPRASGVVFPGLPGSDGSTKRCTAANSAVGFFEDMQQQEYDALVANKTIAEIFALIVGVLTTLGIVTLGVAAAVGAIIAFVVGLFAHMIPADFDSQFTNDTWADLLCILYCNMNPDASFTEEQYQIVKNDVEVKIGGYAGNWLKEHINLLGVVGLTNAARSNFPGSRDCDLCECGLDLEYVAASGDNSEISAGSVTPLGGNQWDIVSGVWNVIATGDHFAAVGVKDSQDRCFKITAIDLIVNNYGQSFRALCAGGSGYGDVIDFEINAAVFDARPPANDETPFTIRVTAILV